MRKGTQLLALSFVTILIWGCSVIGKVLPQERAYQGLSLGALGVLNARVDSGFEVKALPDVHGDLHISVNEQNFTKSGFKRFEDLAKREQLNMEYVDSIPVKPQYHTIEIIDDIAYAKAMNEAGNDHVYAFAKANSDTKVITKISLVFKGNAPASGSGYYLRNDTDGSMLLFQKKSNENDLRIDLENTIIFNYETSSLCWGEGSFGKIKVRDLIASGQSCKKPLVEKVARLTKSTNLYKY